MSPCLFHLFHLLCVFSLVCLVYLLFPIFYLFFYKYIYICSLFPSRVHVNLLYTQEQWITNIFVRCTTMRMQSSPWRSVACFRFVWHCLVSQWTTCGFQAITWTNSRKNSRIPLRKHPRQDPIPQHVMEYRIQWEHRTRARWEDGGGGGGERERERERVQD
jgi:hypothetical protein